MSNSLKKTLLLVLLFLSLIATLTAIQDIYEEKPIDNLLQTEAGNLNWLIILLAGVVLINLIVIIILSLPFSSKPNTKKLVHSDYENEWRAMAKQIAHEIKNPLTPLKLGVQLLEKSWRDKDPNFSKKFEKFTQSFVEQIDSLSFIASEFFNFAKMPDVAYEEINIQEIITQITNIYENLPELSIHFNSRAETPIFIKGNKEQLLRIFNSLIKNAIEAIPDYRQGIIEIILERTNGSVQIQVKDNGNGIPADLHEIIFRPNFTTKSSGTGLGLAFVKQAVENMKGEVCFETEQNVGTTFYISIPIVS